MIDEPKTENFVAEDNDDILNFGEEFDKKEFELIDEGKYEVVLEKLERKTSSKGSKYLNLTFQIRRDVEQNFKGRKLFYTIFAQDGDRAYNFNVINKIILTQKNRSDYKTHFKDIDEVLQYLIGLRLIVEVEISFDEYSGTEKNKIVDWSFEPSIWDTQDHSQPAAEPEIIKQNTEALDEAVPDDDLPF